MALQYCRLLVIAILTLQLTISLGIPLFKDIDSSDKQSENGVLNLQKKYSVAPLNEEKDQASVHLIRKKRSLFPLTITSDQPSTSIRPGITKVRLNRKDTIPSTDELVNNTSLRNKNNKGIVSTPGQNRNGMGLLSGIKKENETTTNRKPFTESHPTSKAAEEYTTMSSTSKSTSKTDAQEHSSLNTEKTAKPRIKDIREKIQSPQENTINMKLMENGDSSRQSKSLVKSKVSHSNEDSSTLYPTRKNDYQQNKMVDMENVIGNSFALPLHQNMSSVKVNSDQSDANTVLKEFVTSDNGLDQKTISSIEKGTATIVATEKTEVKQDHGKTMPNQENIPQVNAQNNLPLTTKSDEIETRSKHEESDVKNNGSSQKMKGTPLFSASAATELNKGSQKITAFFESAAHFLSLLVGSGRRKTSSNSIEYVTTENTSKQEGKSNSEDNTINSTVYATSAINEDHQKVVTNKNNNTPTVTNDILSLMKSVQLGTSSSLKVAQSSNDISHQEENESSKSVVPVVPVVREDHQKEQLNKDNTTPSLGDTSTSEIADHKVLRVVLANPENATLSTRVTETSESKIRDIPKFRVTNYLNTKEPSTNEHSKLDNTNYLLMNEASSLKTTNIPEQENAKINTDNPNLHSDTNKTMDLFWQTILLHWNKNYTSGTHEISTKGVVTLIPEMSVRTDHGNIGTSPGTTVKDVTEKDMTAANENELQRLSHDRVSFNPATTEKSAFKLGKKLNHVPMSKNVQQLSEMQELFNGLHLPSTGVILQREEIL